MENKTLELCEKYTKMMEFTGRVPAKDRVTLTEALTSADANILIPKVVSQVIFEAGEPVSMVAPLFQRVTLTEGRSMEFIHFGAIRAFEIGEGQEYPNQALNLAAGGIDSVDVKVKKYGLRVAITEEMIDDSQWDVIGLHLRAAGRAMSQKKEEICFQEFSTHGHTVFDADAYAPGQEGFPTGRGFDGNLNGTLAAEDIIDMAVCIMAAGFTPTTIIMHPLCWSLFARNAALEGTNVAAFGQGAANFDPRNFGTSNALGLEVIFSPFVPFNHAEKKFDFYIIDRNNIGVMLVKDELSTENFDDPTRDIYNMKVRERYGVGVLNGGQAITVAKNIKFLRTFPAPERAFKPMDVPTDWASVGAGETHPLDRI